MGAALVAGFRSLRIRADDESHRVQCLGEAGDVVEQVTRPRRYGHPFDPRFVFGVYQTDGLEYGDLDLHFRDHTAV